MANVKYKGVRKIASARKLDKRKMDMVLADTEYTKSKLPIACDHKGIPSITAELGMYIGSDEGMELLRRGIRTLLVNFAHGDRSAAKLLLSTAPNISHLDVTGLVGHVVTAAHTANHTLSPAELRNVERERVILDIPTREPTQKPIEVVHQ